MKKPMKKVGDKKKMQRGGMVGDRGMTAGAGSGMGRMEKAGMKGYKCGGKVMSKRGYGAAKKGK